jgi:hypothetical protein
MAALSSAGCWWRRGVHPECDPCAAAMRAAPRARARPVRITCRSRCRELCLVGVFSCLCTKMEAEARVWSSNCSSCQSAVRLALRTHSLRWFLSPSYLQNVFFSLPSCHATNPYYSSLTKLPLRRGHMTCVVLLQADGSSSTVAPRAGPASNVGQGRRLIWDRGSQNATPPSSISAPFPTWFVSLRVCIENHQQNLFETGQSQTSSRPPMSSSRKRREKKKKRRNCCERDLTSPMTDEDTTTDRVRARAICGSHLTEPGSPGQDKQEEAALR